MPRIRALSIPHSFVRAAALVIIGVASGGAGCPGDAGETEGGTDVTLGGSSFGTDNPTDPSSTTNPSTTTPTTTSSSTTTTPTTDPDTGTTDPTDTAGFVCGGGGPFTVGLTDRDDTFGHFPFLLLFFPEDPPTTEVFEVVVGADGAVTINLQPRAAGSGSGHSGLTGLTGTIDGGCAVSIDTEAEYVSDTGPFGTVQVILDGTFPSAGDGVINGTMTLQGGNIPNGPITYTFSGQ